MAPSASSCHPIGTGGSASGRQNDVELLPERDRAASQSLQPNDGTSVVGGRACERGFHESTVERCEQREIVDRVERGTDLPDGDERALEIGSVQGGVASATLWPSSSRRAVAEASAATHSGSTGASTGGIEVTATRNVPGGSVTLSANGRSGGAHQGSPGSYPARTSSRWAASTTDREIGPDVERPSRDVNGALDTRPREGLRPKTPQHDAGIRIEPPPSVPWATGRRPAARAAAAPPLEPPACARYSMDFALLHSGPTQ